MQCAERSRVKIAIVGSGISGLTAAHLLYREHDITLFEAADRVGAQAHTMNVSLDGRDYAIDVGFAVFSDQTCPNFSALLDRLGVPFRPTENSYSVHDRASGLEYKGSNLNTLFAQRSNLFRLPFWTMLREIRRFNRESLDDHANKRIAAQVTLGEYLRLGGYGERFIDHYIVPMGGATWSMSRRQLLQTPLECFIRLFESLGLLSAGQDRRWYVVDGGSRGLHQSADAGVRPANPAQLPRVRGAQGSPRRDRAQPARRRALRQDRLRLSQRSGATADQSTVPRRDGHTRRTALRSR